MAVVTGGVWSTFCEEVAEIGWEGGGGGEVVFGDDKVRLKKSIISSALVVFGGGSGSIGTKAILDEGSELVLESFPTAPF